MRRIDKNRLQIIVEYVGMTAEQRNKALIEEQKQKFFSRGGKVTKINPVGRDINEIISRRSQLEAIEFLEA